MRPQQLLVYRARARRRRTARKQILVTVLAGFIAIVLAVGAEALDQYNYYTSDLPDPGTLDISQLPQSTQILDRNGKLLYVRHGAQIRTVVPLARISPLLRKATIDVEDKNFYTNSGLDYQRLAAAAYGDLSGHPLQGASTITQQLVKLKYLTSERSLDRKIKEALLAGQLEGRFSKDQILETYLNSILLRPPGLRHRGRQPDLLRQARRRAEPQRGQPAGWHPPGAERLRPADARWPGAGSEAAGKRAAGDGQPGRHHAGAEGPDPAGACCPAPGPARPGAAGASLRQLRPRVPAPEIRHRAGRQRRAARDHQP